MSGFQLFLRNDKIKQYDLIALLVNIINLAVLGYISIYAPQKIARISAGTGSFVLLLSIVIDQFLLRIKHNTDTPYRFAGLYIAAIAWAEAGPWWMMLTCFIIGLLYQVAKRPLLVIVSVNDISYPSFPKKKISWNQLNNLVLKDGLLTIDFNNNHIIQQLIDETKPAPDEQEFNDFCRAQLSK